MMEEGNFIFIVEKILALDSAGKDLIRWLKVSSLELSNRHHELSNLTVQGCLS